MEQRDQNHAGSASARPFPFRWFLPALQFSICFAALWPTYFLLALELAQSKGSYWPSHSPAASNQVLNIEIPILTPKQQKAADRVFEIQRLRMKVPVALNLPVGIAQLPYVIPSRGKKEWVPQGMTTDTWRAVTWPFAGVLFWWLAGRGVEALLASRKKIVSPRLTLPETLFAAVFVCGGVAALVGIIISTPDDRRDFQFLLILGGGLLWGVLASLTIAARISQWNLRRKMRLSPST